MSLTHRDVEAIAHLARLQITEMELPVYVASLSKILDWVDQLAAVDTSAVAPMAHPLSGEVQRLRPDQITESDHHERYQGNAPQVVAGLYSVPKVIE